MPWVSQGYLDRLEAAAEYNGQLADINRTLTKFLPHLKRIAGAERPGVIYLQTRSQEGTMLTFDIVLPPATASDTTKGELAVTIGNAEPQVIETAVGQERVTGLSGEDGAPVSASFVFIDDANNRSEPSTLEAVLTDTIAPPQPGSLGIEVTGEN